MILLGKLVLALLALGMQLPALPALALCLCGLVPFTCAAGGGCAKAPEPAAISPSGEPASSCCSDGRDGDQRGDGLEEGESGRRAVADPEGASCCGCELDLATPGDDPSAPGPPRDPRLSPAAAPASGTIELPGAAQDARPLRLVAARGHAPPGARVNAPLRI